ncbi:tetratricopeptide repeat protein, partial [Acidobacteriota bacterium]
MGVKNSKNEIVLMLIAGLIFLWCAAATAQEGEKKEKSSLAESDPQFTQIKKLINETGQYAEAERQARALLAKTEKEHGKDSPEAASVLDILVESLWRGGKTGEEETRTLAERAVSIKEKSLGAEHLELATSLNNLAILHTLNGDYATAIPYFEKTIAIWEKTFGPEHFYVGMGLGNLSLLWWRVGEYEKARSGFERNLALWEKTLGPADPKLAAVLSNLGNLLQETGHYKDAEPLYRRALSILEKAVGKEHPDIANNLNSLASLLHLKGDYSGSRPLYERALAIREKSLDPGHPDIAMSLNNLANLHYQIGDYGKARLLFESALEIYKKAFGPDHPHVAANLTNLGGVLKALQEYEESMSAYTRALEIREKALGPDHPKVADSLNHLGGLLLVTGGHAKAQPLIERALAIREKSLEPGHPDIAVSLASLGDIFKEMEDYDQAKRLYGRAQRIQDKAFGTHHPSVAENLNRSADLLCRMGEYPSALENALRAEKISRDHLRLTVQTLPERQALRYATVRSSGLDIACSMAVLLREKTPSSIPQVWDVLINSRALVLDEMSSRNRSAREGENEKNSALAERLFAARQRLANISVRDRGELSPDRYLKLIEAAQKEKEDAERVLAEASASFRKSRTIVSAGLTEVAKALPEGSALIAYARYNRYESSPEPAYLAFVIKKGVPQPAIVPLGKAVEIEDLIKRWKEETGPGLHKIRRSEKEAEAQYRAAGKKLRQRIWDPIAPRVKGANLMFIVPDGAINLVSFAALPVSKNQYLTEKEVIFHYLSAERDIVSATIREKVGTGLLVMGGPDFNDTSLFAQFNHSRDKSGTEMTIRTAVDHFRGSRSGCGYFNSLLFKNLPGTNQEVQEIIALWKDNSNDKAGDVEIVALLGSEANETSFKQNAPGKKVLHLAT